MTEKTKKLYHTFLLILSLALLAGLGFYVQKNTTTFTQLKSVKFEYIVFLIFIHAIVSLLMAVTHKLPLKKLNINLNFKEWYGLCVVAELFNMLLPANGGTGIRMLYIKDKKNLPMREFLTMSFAMVLIGSTLLGIIGIGYCEFFLTKSDTIFIVLESVFVALTVSGIILIFAAEGIARIFKFRRKSSPRVYLKDFRLTSLVTLCWLAMIALYPLKMYLSFLAIGIDLTLAQSVELSLILLAASLFQVLPGNLGIKEIVTTYVAQRFGIPMEAALIASLIDRVILLLFLFPVGFYFYWQLFLEAALPKALLPFLSRPKQSAQISP